MTLRCIPLLKNAHAEKVIIDNIVMEEKEEEEIEANNDECEETKYKSIKTNDKENKIK